MFFTLTLIYILFIIGLTFSKYISLYRGVPLTNKEKKPVEDTVESEKESQESKEESSSPISKEQPQSEEAEKQPVLADEQSDDNQEESDDAISQQDASEELKPQEPEEPMGISPSDEKKPAIKPTKQEKKEKPAPKKEKPEEKDDFLYIVRLANSDIDGKKQVMHGLTQIKGIGRRLAITIADKAGVDRTMKMGNLSEKQLTNITQALESLSSSTPGWMLNHRKDVDSGEDIHLISADIDLRLRDDVNKLKMIRSYRGIRHESGLPCRGQRTRANSRKGLAMGVSRKSQQPT